LPINDKPAYVPIRRVAIPAPTSDRPFGVSVHSSNRKNATKMNTIIARGMINFFNCMIRI
jgi:hypothetical protein